MATSVKYPTANTATTGFNGVANAPTDAYTDNTVYANFVPSKPRNDEDAHSWGGFDFSAIADGSTINSVTVKVQEYVSASWAEGQWRVALFADVTSAGALAPGVTTAIGAVQYTRATTDTAEFEWDLGTLSTEPTLAQLKGANFGVRIEAAQGNNGTSHTWYVDTIEITVDYTSAATDYQRSEDEAVGVTDSTVRVHDAVRSETETVGVTDDTTRVVAYKRNIIEAVGVTDDTTPLRALTDEIDDPVGVTDDTAAVKTITAAVIDPVGVTDEVTHLHTLARPVDEPVGVTDSTTSAKTILVTITDTVGVTDSTVPVEVNVTTVVNLLLGPSTDPGTSTDHSVIVRHRGTSGGSATVKLLEGVTDRASFPLTVTTSWGETEYTLSGGEADSITDYTDLHITVEENPLSSTGWLQISQIYMRLLILTETPTDDVGVTDSTTAVKAITVAITDAVGVTDSTDHAHVVARPVTDDVGVTDDTTPAKTITVAITDAVGVTDDTDDVLSGGGEHLESEDEAVGVTDAPSRVVDYVRTVKPATVLDSAELLLRAQNYSGTGGWLDEAGNSHHAQFGTGTPGTNDPQWLGWDGENYLYKVAAAGTLSLADSVPLSITGDIDIRCDCALDDWTPGTQNLVISKQGSYKLSVKTTGYIELDVTQSGGQSWPNSGVATGFTDGTRHWIRVTRVSSTGTTKFYTSENGTDWDQLGSDKSSRAGESIVDTANGVVVGESTFVGSVWAAQIFSDVTGTTAQLDLNLDDATEPFATFTEASSNAATVTINHYNPGLYVVDRPAFGLHTDDYFVVPDDPGLDFAADEDMTLVVAYRPSAVPPAGTEVLFDKRVVGVGPGYVLESLAGSSGLINAQVPDGSGNAQSNVGIQGSSRVAATASFRVDRTAESVKSFSDGTVSGSAGDTSGLGTLANAADSYVGTYFLHNNLYLDGEIIGVALWRSALSDADVATAGDALLGASDADPIGVTDSVTAAKTITVEITEAVAVADVPLTASATARIVTDDVGVTDLTTRDTVTKRAIVEAVGVIDDTDDVKTGAGVEVVTEAVGVTDSTTRVHDAKRTVADPVGVTDDTTAVKAIAVEIIEAVGVTDLAVDDLVLGNRLQKAVDDSVGVTDLTSRVHDAVRDVTDPVGVTDDTTPVKTIQVAIVDAVGVTDDTVTASVAARTITDDVGVTDSTGRVTVTERTITDDVGVIDNTDDVKTGAGVEVVTDPVGVTDLVSRVHAAERSEDETVGVTDTVASAKAIVAEITDAVGVTDSTTNIETNTEVVTEAVGVTDLTATAKAIAAEITDAVGVTDDTTPVEAGGIAITRTATDPVGVTDTTTRIASAVRTPTDTVGVTDSTTRDASFVRETTETLNLTDDTQVAKTIVVTITESVDATDSTSPSMEIVRTVTDDVGITDTPVRAIEWARIVSDDVAVTDSVVLSTPGAEVVTESVGVTDFTSYVKWVSVVEDENKPRRTYRGEGRVLRDESRDYRGSGRIYGSNTIPSS